MAAQTDIPSDLTDDSKAFVFQVSNAGLNSLILYALLYGIYTGILAVSLWNISINKCWPIRRAIIIIIILLHVLITINFAASWSIICFAFIKNGHNFWTTFLILEDNTLATYWVTEIAASISTILTDSYIIWCCWMVWGQHWLVVLLPILSLVSAIVSRTVHMYYNTVPDAPIDSVSLMLYISFILATTLSCTILIIYRIVAVVGVRHGPAGRLGVFRHFIEVLVESSALYSICLILELAFIIRNDFRVYYLDAIASMAKVCP
ncbi:hypothetical protein ARMGADRAFT_486679 [Armillaria gallica]|uniref:Integral membrane protein n=1 Tax=Armillaria gallica TaxID=47427 RepID=A0A2H3E5P4_ARMGA|nr:hypothetical protein ARMGADRAFT_486679 [Armillaria gallica]